MHGSVSAWVAEQVSANGLAAKNTLEVASFAQSDLPEHCPTRHLFTGPFIGVDKRPGPNVDRVADASDLPFADSTFDVVVCTEMLEHDLYPWGSVREMARVLSPGGCLILTARGFDDRGCYPVHDHPVDYWRFTPGAVFAMLDVAGLVGITTMIDPECPGVFATALGK